MDFKADQKFSEHMKDQAVVSEFAKKKTLLQQRQYLPVFAVRQEVTFSLLLAAYLESNRNDSLISISMCLRLSS